MRDCSRSTGSVLVLLLALSARGLEGQPTGAPPASERPVVPEKLDFTIAPEQRQTVFIARFAVRVDNKKDFTKIHAKVVAPREHRWLSLRGSSDPVTVVSPSTQVFEVSIDPGQLSEESGAGVIEITGARSEVLRLPVSLRFPPAPKVAQAPQAPQGPFTAPEHPPRSPVTPEITPKQLEEILKNHPPAGSANPSKLTFVVEPGKPLPPEQSVELSLPVAPDAPSPIVSYAAVRKRAVPKGTASPPAEPASIDWLAVQPEGVRRALAGEKPVHKVSVNPGNLPPGSYPAFIVFQFPGLGSADIFVLIEMKIGPLEKPASGERPPDVPPPPRGGR